ncbi:MAG: FAD-dependent thymidylate synthase [Halobacteriota archaeon]
MIKVEGKAGISVTILAHSISEAGIPLITYELVYARMVHSELLTHSMLVRNAASSRAIPFAKMAAQLTARPVRFGQANPGMQDKGIDYDKLVEGRSVDLGPQWEHANPVEALESYEAWEKAKEDAIFWSKAFYEAGYHKQVYNRITEPYQMIKVVLSGTELENFFWLRNHGAADPTLEELARCMQEAREQSTPELLKAGDWHLPYVFIGVDKWHERAYYEDELRLHKLTLDEAIKVSCARTAAASFRNSDYTLEKCLEVYERLIGDDRKHASAFQHQATPMKEPSGDLFGDVDEWVNWPNSAHTWEPGVSHADRNGQLWSAQFRGWVMYRKLIPGENYVG